MQIRIDKVKPGSILGDHIYSESRVCLYRYGRVLTAEDISRLERLGYSTIPIQTRFSKEIKDRIPDELVSRVGNNFRNISDKDSIKNIIASANEIAKNVLSRAEMSIDYSDSRNVDNHLLQHSIAVAEISLIIGKSLNLNNIELRELAITALLHDIGKMFDNPKFLSLISSNDKKSTIKYNENAHSLYGYLFLRNKLEPTKICLSILAHHLNQDGTGFTGAEELNEKLTKQNLLYAHIIHVADEFDLKKSTPGITPSEALSYIEAGYGTMFSERVVTAFRKYVAIYPTDNTVRLSNGIGAVVTGQNPGLPDRPKIRILKTGGEFQEGQYIDLAREARNLTILNIDDSLIYDEVETLTKAK